MTSHTPETVRRAIIRCLILAPKTLNELANLLKGFELKDLVRELREMVLDGTAACTSKRFWLRGLARADLVKVEDDRQRDKEKRYG